MQTVQSDSDDSVANIEAYLDEKTDVESVEPSDLVPAPITPSLEKWNKIPRARGRQPRDPQARSVQFRCPDLEDLESKFRDYLQNPTAPAEHATVEFEFPESAAFMVYSKDFKKEPTKASERTLQEELKRTAVSVIDVLKPMEDARHQMRRQKAVAKICVEAVQRVDGFKYSFHNNWLSREDEASRFSYYCNDSVLNKGRAVNGAPATAGKAKRKPVYDCDGLVTVKFSLVKKNLEVHYHHVPLHATYAERAPEPRRNSRRRRIMEVLDPGSLKPMKARSKRRKLNDPPLPRKRVRSKSETCDSIVTDGVVDLTKDVSAEEDGEDAENGTGQESRRRKGRPNGASAANLADSSTPDIPSIPGEVLNVSQAERCEKDTRQPKASKSARKTTAPAPVPEFEMLKRKLLEAEQRINKLEAEKTQHVPPLPPPLPPPPQSFPPYHYPHPQAQHPCYGYPPGPGYHLWPVGAPPQHGPLLHPNYQPHHQQYQHHQGYQHPEHGQHKQDPQQPPYAPYPAYQLQPQRTAHPQYQQHQHRHPQQGSQHFQHPSRSLPPSNEGHQEQISQQTQSSQTHSRDHQQTKVSWTSKSLPQSSSTPQRPPQQAQERSISAEQRSKEQQVLLPDKSAPPSAQPGRSSSQKSHSQPSQHVGSQPQHSHASPLQQRPHRPPLPISARIIPPEQSTSYAWPSPAFQPPHPGSVSNATAAAAHTSHTSLMGILKLVPGNKSSPDPTKVPDVPKDGSRNHASGEPESEASSSASTFKAPESSAKADDAGARAESFTDSPVTVSAPQPRPRPVASLAPNIKLRSKSRKNVKARNSINRDLPKKTQFIMYSYRPSSQANRSAARMDPSEMSKQAVVSDPQADSENEAESEGESSSGQGLRRTGTQTRFRSPARSSNDQERDRDSGNGPNDDHGADDGDDNRAKLLAELAAEAAIAPPTTTKVTGDTVDDQDGEDAGEDFPGGAIVVIDESDTSVTVTEAEAAPDVEREKSTTLQDR